MHKNNLIYIEHIKSSIDKIKTYTEGLTEEDFLANQLVQDAVIRNFEIIGEAVKQLSAEFRKNTIISHGKTLQVCGIF